MNWAFRAALGLLVACGAVALMGAAANRRTVSQSVNGALVLYHGDAGRYTAETESALRQAVATDLSGDLANFRLGRLLHQRSGERDRDEAADRYRASIRANPFRGAAHYWLGYRHAERGHWVAANRQMRLAATLAANQPDMQYKIGYHFYRRWKKTGDLRYLDESLAFFRTAGTLDIGYLLRILKVLQEFALQYDTLANIIPNTEEAHYVAGKYFGHQTGMWLFALREFEKARGMASLEARFPLEYGLALLHNKRFKEARLRILQGLDATGGTEKDIKDLYIHFQAAQALDEGAKLWRELIALYPQRAAPLVNLAKVRMTLARKQHGDRVREIDEALRKALATAPPGERQWLRETTRKKKEEAFRQAFLPVRAYLLEAVEKVSNVALCFYLAEVERLLGNSVQAEHWVRKALEVDGSNARVWYWYVNFLMEQRRFEDAYNQVKRARAKLPENKRLQHMEKIALDRMVRERGAKKEDENREKK